jgi:hypothetical protein
MNVVTIIATEALIIATFMLVLLGLLRMPASCIIARSIKENAGSVATVMAVGCMVTVALVIGCLI